MPKFEVGDLVWAKMKGFCPWPAKTINPPATARKPQKNKIQHFVYFFGSKNHAWVLEENIFPHSDDMVEDAKKKTSKSLQVAVEEIMKCAKYPDKKDKDSSKNQSVKNIIASDKKDKDSNKKQDGKNIVATTKVSNKKQDGKNIVATSKDPNKKQDGKNVVATSKDPNKKQNGKNIIATSKDPNKKQDGKIIVATTKDSKSKQEGKNIVATAKDSDKKQDGKNIVATAKDSDKKQYGKNIVATAKDSDKKQDGKNIVATAKDSDKKQDGKNIVATAKDSNKKQDGKNVVAITKASTKKESVKNAAGTMKNSSKENVEDTVTSTIVLRKRKSSFKSEEESPNSLNHKKVKVIQKKITKKQIAISLKEGRNSASKSPKISKIQRTSVVANATGGKRCSSLGIVPIRYGQSSSKFSTRNFSEGSSLLLDIKSIKKDLSEIDVKPALKRIGFLGLGLISEGIVKNLLKARHNVMVWDESVDKCETFVAKGAARGETPADVVCSCDIIFCWVEIPIELKQIISGKNGVLEGLQRCNATTKDYIELSTIDPELSEFHASEIILKGARYLEAPVTCSKKDAEKGTLLAIAAGSRMLFEECRIYFRAFADKTYFLSPEVGTALKMHIIYTSLHGATYLALSETMALVDCCPGLKQQYVLDFLKLMNINCRALSERAKSIINRDYTVDMPLRHMTRNTELTLKLGNAVIQPMPVTAATNASYRHAELLQTGDQDVSAVYEGTQQ